MAKGPTREKEISNREIIEVTQALSGMIIMDSPSGVFIIRADGSAIVADSAFNKKKCDLNPAQVNHALANDLLDQRPIIKSIQPKSTEAWTEEFKKLRKEYAVVRDIIALPDIEAKPGAIPNLCKKFAVTVGN